VRFGGGRRSMQQRFFFFCPGMVLDVYGGLELIGYTGGRRDRGVRRRAWRTSGVCVHDRTVSRGEMWMSSVSECGNGREMLIT
jgi:hypothetical protein